MDKVFHAIRRGFVPGITVDEFRRRCGLNTALSLLVVEFFLCTQIRSGKEYVISDTLIEQTIARPRFDPILARLYFFALNLAMPGDRLRLEQRDAGQLQRHVVGAHVYVNDGWDSARIEKDASLEPFVRSVSTFPSVRKWVNNYWFMMRQCKFVIKPDGKLETFADTWGLLALRLFFDRCSVLHPDSDAQKLVKTSLDLQIYELFGVPQSWLAERAEGAVDMYMRREPFGLDLGTESSVERDAAKSGTLPPRPESGSPADRRRTVLQRLIRRGENRRFIKALYSGVCQISGVILRLPSGDFSVDCAHIRPLGNPHRGPDDVRNMLSLSPTIHRLFDHGCIQISPEDLSIKLLHGNAMSHRARLIVNEKHGLSMDHISYYNMHILR